MDYKKIAMAAVSLTAPFMGHAQSAGAITDGEVIDIASLGKASAVVDEVSYTKTSKDSNPKTEYARGAAAFRIFSKQEELGDFKIHYLVDGRDVNALPENVALISEAKALLEANSKAHVEISSSTSSTGSEKYNLELSRDRSNAVFKALELAGIPPERLRIVNVGESEALEATGDEVESGPFRSTKIRVVEGERKELAVRVKHVIYIDPKTTPDFTIFNPPERYWNDLQANHPNADIVRETPQDILVVDVSRSPNKPITITLDGLSQEVIDNMTVATYDASGGRGVNVARIRGGEDGVIAVEALNVETGKWQPVADVVSLQGQDLSRVATKTIEFGGAVVDVGKGETHVASQPTVHPGPAFNSAIPAAAPLRGQTPHRN